MPDDGRISICGLTEENVRHVAEAIKETVLDGTNLNDNGVTITSGLAIEGGAKEILKVDEDLEHVF